jgi:hypothetical protein
MLTYNPLVTTKVLKRRNPSWSGRKLLHRDNKPGAALEGTDAT